MLCSTYQLNQMDFKNVCTVLSFYLNVQNTNILIIFSFEIARKKQTFEIIKNVQDVLFKIAKLMLICQLWYIYYKVTRCHLKNKRLYWQLSLKIAIKKSIRIHCFLKYLLIWITFYGRCYNSFESYNNIVIHLN